MKTLFASLALLATLATTPASAFYIQFTDPIASPSSHFMSDIGYNAFISAVENAGVVYAKDDLEAYTPGSTSLTADFGVLGTLTLGGGTLGNTAHDGLFSASSPGSSAGSQFWETSASTVSLLFSQPVLGFAFYGIDFNDFAGDYPLITVTTVGGVSQSYTLGGSGADPSGSVRFWGLFSEDDSIANAIASVSFSTQNGTSLGDLFALDNLILAGLPQQNPVPEPGTLALLGLGLCGLNILRSRRRVS